MIFSDMSILFHITEKTKELKVLNVLFQKYTNRTDVVR